MSGKLESKYDVGLQPPLTLTEKARKQLDSAKPSTKVAALAKALLSSFNIKYQQ